MPPLDDARRAFTQGRSVGRLQQPQQISAEMLRRARDRLINDIIHPRPGVSFDIQEWQREMIYKMHGTLTTEERGSNNEESIDSE